MTETKWTWNLGRLAKIAGVQLNEVWDRDDDDEDPDAKIAGEDKRQKAFEKKNKGELKAAAAATPPKKADKKPAEKKEEPKAEEKKEEPKAEEKKEEPKAEEKKEEEAKKRGRAANPESFNQHAKANAKSMSRGQFITWAAEKHGKGKNYASSLFAKYNPKSSRQVAEAKEVWILTHPHMPSFTLAENYEMKQMQWVDATSPFSTVVHLSEAEAQKTAKFMSEWRGQTSVIEKITFED
jgi:outer membrane biosynthesis protein TonB